jgi:hypothetical protein
MSHGNSSSEALASGSKCNFQLHLFFAGTHRQPRYLTDSTGKVVAASKTRDAFEIWQGEVGALVFVYSSQERRAVDAQSWLVEAGYTEFLACGLINGQRAEWIFTKPADSEACKCILRDAAGDPMLLPDESS